MSVCSHKTSRDSWLRELDPVVVLNGEPAGGHFTTFEQPDALVRAVEEISRRAQPLRYN